jgi:diacylglycerol kinase (ATP)
MRRIIISIGHALRGLRGMFASEPNMRIHLVAALVAIGGGYVLRLSWTEWALLVFAMTLVLAAEAMNTAIEVLCDFVHPEHSEAIRRAKDSAAGGVLLCAMGAVIVAAVLVASRW